MSEMNDTLVHILQETTKYDFPFLANMQKKEAIISEKKSYIENRIDKLLKDENVNVELQYDVLWEEARVRAAEQFDYLPDKVKINGFYLQELMHTYVELISEKIKAAN